MSVYIDTSAFLAILNADDEVHQRASRIWLSLLDTESRLITNSSVLVEAYALIQRRLGMDAARSFAKDILPVIEIIWIDEEIYQQSLVSFLSANRRNLSLVDCTSFVTMFHSNISRVFTFDAHFAEQGFEILKDEIIN